MPLRILPLPQASETRAARILDARTRHLATRGAARESRPVSPPLLLCTLGNEAYGLPLASVAQVVPFAPCTPAPGQPAAMLGFHGRAGQVFVVLDLGLALGMGAARQGSHLLLLRHAPAASPCGWTAPSAPPIPCRWWRPRRRRTLPASPPRPAMAPLPAMPWPRRHRRRRRCPGGPHRPRPPAAPLHGRRPQHRPRCHRSMTP
ncbi:chemotaxis protein CheW [Pseudoroseomonas wenyumeiae]